MTLDVRSQTLVNVNIQTMIAGLFFLKYVLIYIYVPFCTCDWAACVRMGVLLVMFFTQKLKTTITIRHVTYLRYCFCVVVF